MAKQTFPGIKTGGGLLPKVVGTMVALAVLVVVVKYPGDAAAWVKDIGSMVGGVIDGLAAFIRNITG